MMMHCVIVGTGDMAHGLAHLYSNNKSAFSGHTLEVTKPGLEKSGSFHNTGVPLGKFSEALDRADIVILAIPASVLKRFVYENYPHLRSKILVDVTNSSIPGEDLISLCRLTQVRWVKAFNDIGAVDILLNKPFSKNKVATTMCASDKITLAIVKRYAEETLGLAVKVVPQERYYDVAMHQNSLGTEWVHATYVMLIVFAFTELYAILRYNVYKGYGTMLFCVSNDDGVALHDKTNLQLLSVLYSISDWFHLPFQVTNKGVCWTALNGFALTQLPGLLARIGNVVQKNTLLTKPSCLQWALRIRKQVGLLSLWFLMIHILMRYASKQRLQALGVNNTCNSLMYLL
jgi:predicted dinucleotide-binding enzyme